MGASIGMLHGMEKARGPEFAKKAVAVIGDSTFIHSGITGLVDLVYNKGHGTVIILDNNTTGMTGHQHHPGTGFDLRGRTHQPVGPGSGGKGRWAYGGVQVIDSFSLPPLSLSLPFALAELEKAVKEEVAAEEPSVIIARRPCSFAGPGQNPGLVGWMKKNAPFAGGAWRLAARRWSSSARPGGEKKGGSL